MGKDKTENNQDRTEARIKKKLETAQSQISESIQIKCGNVKKKS